ncbi:MAG: glycosyltransferase [Bacteroidales bacterium]|nr:glycosyltransferase [Bacteroidales bacterium]
MIKLSVITINFNNDSGLKKTIDSVKNQTSSQFECIIIDGGSTDNSIDQIKEFETVDKRLAHWISEPDNGIYHAMNKGIKLASGKYVQFLNSGDYYMDSTVVESVISCMDNDAGILYGNLVKIFPKYQVCDKGFSGRKPTMIDFYRGTLNHLSSFIRKELFDIHGYYDESLKAVADWKWFLQAVVFGNESIQYIDLDVVCFDTKGLSSSNPELCTTERVEVLNKLLPQNIIIDYERHSRAIMAWNRIKRYKLIFYPVNLIERILFKLEQRKISRSKIVVNKL